MTGSDSAIEARRALGRRLAGERRSEGLNQIRFAPLTGYSRSTVANVETGRQHVARDFWERCDHVFGTNGEYARAHDEIETMLSVQHEQAVREAEADRLAAVSFLDRIDSGEEREEGSPSKRRQALGLLWTAFAGSVAPDVLAALERVADPTPSRVDRRLIRANEELAETLAGLYGRGDPRISLPPTIALANNLLELLGLPMSEAVRADLMALVVGVHCQVGLWACHLHRGTLALRYLATACEIGSLSGDRPLRARALGALSYLYSSAPRGGHGGQPQRALDLLDEALDPAQRVDGFTRGWLATWRADQHATLGNLEAARADAQTAAGRLGRHEGEALTGFFSRRNYGQGMVGHLRSVHGVILALEGRADEAARTFDAVQKAAHNGRRKVATHAHQALALVGTGEAQAACASLRDSAVLAVTENYDLGIQRSSGVRRNFPQEWAGLPCVRDLDDQFQALAVRRG
jgi:transcriptional regulator with XRE-family HTH domain